MKPARENSGAGSSAGSDLTANAGSESGTWQKESEPVGTGSESGRSRKPNRSSFSAGYRT